MKLGVFGSRSLNDDRVAMLICEELQKTGATMLVTAQEPAGVCTVAQQVARREAIPIELHFLNCDKYARGAFHFRSQEVIDSCDKVLLIHDGVSQGTSNELEQCKKSGRDFRYEVLEVDKLGHKADAKLETFYKNDFSDYRF